MAEVFGVIAGGLSVVSLSIQIAESISKLRDIFTSIRDSPSAIQLMLDEMSVLSLVLQDIEQSIQDKSACLPTYRTALVKSLQLCHMSKNALKALLRELEKDIGKGKWGAVKAGWLKKERIAELRGRIEGAKTTLMLANQCFYNGAAKQNWEIQRREMTQIKIAITALKEVHTTRPVSVQEEEDVVNDRDCENEGSQSVIPASSACVNSLDKHNTVKSRKRWQRWGFGPIGYRKATRLPNITDNSTSQLEDQEEVEEVQIAIHVPAWLLPRRYQFRAKRAYNGWEYHMRSSFLVPRSSPVFEICGNGDLEGLKQLFQRREASPFDVDEYGWTPLHWALLANLQYDVPRFLLENGADVDSEAVMSCGFKIMPLVLSVRNHSRIPDGSRTEILRTLIRHGAGLLPEVFHYGSLFHMFRGPIEDFSFLLSQITSTEVREETDLIHWYTAFHTQENSNPYYMEIVKLVLTSPITRDILQKVDQYGNRILHYALIRHFYTFNAETKSRCLIHVLIQNGIDIHVISPQGTTALQYLLAMCYQEINCDLKIWDIHPFEILSGRHGRKAAHRWLQILQESGIDVQNYLDKEMEHWEANPESWSGIIDRIISVKIIGPSKFRIEWAVIKDSFDTGSDSWDEFEETDWTEALKNDLPRFWNMASEGIMGDYHASEEEVPRIPGSWC